MLREVESTIECLETFNFHRTRNSFNFHFHFWRTRLNTSPKIYKNYLKPTTNERNFRVIFYREKEAPFTTNLFRDMQSQSFGGTKVLDFFAKEFFRTQPLPFWEAECTYWIRSLFKVWSLRKTPAGEEAHIESGILLLFFAIIYCTTVFRRRQNEYQNHHSISGHSRPSLRFPTILLHPFFNLIATYCWGRQTSDFAIWKGNSKLIGRWLPYTF